MNRQHLDHCVENIRQSLVCSADVTPLVWQWVDRVQEVRIMGNIMHKCRDYDKIRQWGLEHRLDHELNFTGFHWEERVERVSCFNAFDAGSWQLGIKYSLNDPCLCLPLLCYTAIRDEQWIIPWWPSDGTSLLIALLSTKGGDRALRQWHSKLQPKQI